MKEKHASWLKRPPRWSCPINTCKCHKPGFRYEVHLKDHMEACHRAFMEQERATNGSSLALLYIRWFPNAETLRTHQQRLNPLHSWDLWDPWDLLDPWHQPQGSIARRPAAASSAGDEDAAPNNPVSEDLAAEFGIDMEEGISEDASEGPPDIDDYIPITLPRPCPVCGRTLRSRTMVRQHVWRHTTERYLGA